MGFPALVCTRPQVQPGRGRCSAPHHHWQAKIRATGVPQPTARRTKNQRPKTWASPVPGKQKHSQGSEWLYAQPPCGLLVGPPPPRSWLKARGTWLPEGTSRKSTRVQLLRGRREDRTQQRYCCQPKPLHAPEKKGHGCQGPDYSQSEPRQT